MDPICIEPVVEELVGPLSSKAGLQWTVDLDGISWVTVSPGREGACGFTIIWSSHEIIVQLGDHARVELDTSESGIYELRRIVDAVVEGRVTSTVRRFSERFVLELKQNTGEPAQLVVDDGWRLSFARRSDPKACQGY